MSVEVSQMSAVDRLTVAIRRIEVMDGLLARAADALNVSFKMSDMDLGHEIAEFRRSSQPST